MYCTYNVCELILQVSDLTARLSSRDREFDAYRQQVLSKPESKLQAELTMIHMEKVSGHIGWFSGIQCTSPSYKVHVHVCNLL